MRKCSYCGRDNEEEVVNCTGCGTPLVSPSDDGAEEDESDDKVKGDRLISQGMVWLVGGLGVSLATYVLASSNPGGGPFIIATGAIAFGITQIWRGRAFQAGRTRRGMEAHELLNEAARLETTHPEKAVELYAEVVKGFPGTAASAEAERNIQALRQLTGTWGG